MRPEATDARGREVGSPEALAASGDRFLGVAHWRWCTQSQHLSWSADVYTLLKLLPHQPASWKAWLSHVHPDDQLTVRQTLTMPLAAGEARRVYSYRLVRGDGALITVEDRRHIDQSGMCEGVFIEVTPASKLDFDVRRSDAFIHSALEAAGFGTCFQDFVTGYDYCNKALQAIYGLPDSINSFSRDQLSQRQHPQDREFVEREAERCRQSGESLEVEYRITTPAGDQKWIRERGSYQKHRSGKVISYFSIIEDITDKRIELKKFEESRKLLNLALSANDTAIWQWNKTADQQIWSDAFYGLLGVQPGEIPPTQEAWLSLVHPDDREWVARFVRIEGQSEVHAFTYRIVVGGQERWIRESWNDLLDDSGDRVRLGLSADVTDWKERELLQSATESWFDLAVDVGCIGLWSRDSATRANHWNDHVFALLGYEPGAIEPSDEAWIGRIHPDDLERVMATVEDRRKKGEDNIIEYRVVLPNGTVRWLEERGGVMDTATSVRRGVLIDITSQKLFQQRLEENQQRLQLALDTGGMGFWTSNGTEEYWDAQLYRILGYEPFEVPASSESFMKVVHPEDRQRLLAGEKRSRRTGKIAVEEYRIIRPDGSVRWIEARSRVSSNESLNSYGILLDVTDRKERDEMILANSRLASAGQLLRGLAHDYNHFLAVIGASLDTLSNLVHEPKAKRRLLDARQVTTAAALFSRRLINISRYREWQPQVVSLGAQVSQLTRMLKPLMKPGITMLVSCPADLWMVKVDAVEFDSALLNMVVNSRDAMPAGGSIVIEGKNVHLENDDITASSREGDFVQLTVRDTGRGMDQSTLRNALKPFFTTKRMGAGTGLGLSSVVNFAEAAGGYVELDSAPGSGTSVSLFLPRVNGSAIAPEQPRFTLTRGSGELILVVEDDPHMREALMQRLEALGYAVEEAKDASEAVDKLLIVDSIDLVISDIIMPGDMNGIDLRDWLERQIPHIPVLLITSDYELVRSEKKTVFKSCSQRELAESVALALGKPLSS